ncbi:MAG: cobyric acid synthase [Pseudomonadota bacterium]
MTRALMLQGTGSNVGKSMLTAGLCRAFTRRGLTIRPFKPQNMSNNAAVTADGGEIGRAQALQARACGAETSVHMNPVLLKPETERGAQVILQGQRLTHATARDYKGLKPTLLAGVLDSYRRIANQADLVLIEGAGSPAEVNLRPGDIANMGFAEATDAPVCLIGDIDRGGVIAQIVGTQAVLPPEDQDRIKGFLINRFRGDPSLFDDGYAMIAEHTGWPGFGVLPWFAEAHRLPAEDAADLRPPPDREGAGITVAIPRLSRIANFDDFDPLILEPGLKIEMVSPGYPLPLADLVILPGSKSTRGDLAFLRDQGWDIDLAAHHRRGGRILGICGGYQMLGQTISDPEGIEGPPGISPGLALLDVETVMHPKKHLTRVTGTDRQGTPVSGYEIHIGETTGPDCTRAPFQIEGRPEGATSMDGRVTGAYLHGLFTSDAYRQAFLETLGAPPSGLAYEDEVEGTLDLLADHLESHLDLDGLLRLAAPIRDLSA